MTHQIKEERINNYSVSLDGINTDCGIVYEVRIVKMYDESSGTVTKRYRSVDRKAAQRTYNRYVKMIMEESGLTLSKIYDDDGELDGYRMGNYYLMKHYHFDDSYSWIINKDGKSHYFDCEFWKGVDSGEIEICLSFKQGKSRLIELQEGIR